MEVLRPLLVLGHVTAARVHSISPIPVVKHSCGVIQHPEVRQVLHILIHRIRERSVQQDSLRLGGVVGRYSKASMVRYDTVIGPHFGVSVALLVIPVLTVDVATLMTDEVSGRVDFNTLILLVVASTPKGV